MTNKKEDLDIVMSQIDNIVDLLMNKKPKVKEKYHPAPKAKEVKQFLDDTLGRTEKINSSVCVTCNATDVKSYLFSAIDISVLSSPKHTLPPNNRSPP